MFCLGGRKEMKKERKIMLKHKSRLEARRIWWYNMEQRTTCREGVNSKENVSATCVEKAG